MEQIETTTRRIYTCKNDTHTLKAERHDFKTITTWDTINGVNLVITTEYYDEDTNERINNYELNIKCGHCGNPMKHNDVFALLNEERDCDDRCIFALGPVCSCGCGGPNHGRQWLVRNLIK